MALGLCIRVDPRPFAVRFGSTSTARYLPVGLATLRALSRRDPFQMFILQDQQAVADVGFVAFDDGVALGTRAIGHLEQPAVRGKDFAFFAGRFDTSQIIQDRLPGTRLARIGIGRPIDHEQNRIHRVTPNGSFRPSADPSRLRLH